MLRRRARERKRCWYAVRRGGECPGALPKCGALGGRSFAKTDQLPPNSAEFTMVFWLNPPLQKKIEYRPTDTIISVPAKSGTTWTMNIFHQLRTGGDADFKDIYQEVPWVEFKERPDQVSLCRARASVLLTPSLPLPCSLPSPSPPLSAARIAALPNVQSMQANVVSCVSVAPSPGQ